MAIGPETMVGSIHALELQVSDATDELHNARGSHVSHAWPHLRAACDQGALSPGAPGGEADIPPQPPAAGRRLGDAY